MDEKELHEISKAITQEWWAIGIQLLLTNSELENLKAQHPNKSLENLAFQMLILWKQKYPSKFRRSRLITALENENRNDLAKMLKKVDEEKKKKAKTVPDSKSSSPSITNQNTANNTIKQQPINPVNKVIKGHSAAITNIAFSNDGMLIASTSLDSYVKVWQYNSDGHNNGLYETSMKQVNNWESTYNCLFNMTDDYILVAGTTKVAILELREGLPVWKLVPNHLCITHGCWFEDMFLSGVLNHSLCTGGCNDVLCSCTTATAHLRMQRFCRSPPISDLPHKTCEKTLWLNHLKSDTSQPSVPICLHKLNNGIIRLARIMPLKQKNEASLVFEANNSLYVKKFRLHNGLLEHENIREFNLASYGQGYGNPYSWRHFASIGKDNRGLKHYPDNTPAVHGSNSIVRSKSTNYSYRLPDTAKTNEFGELISNVPQPPNTCAPYYRKQRT